MQEQEDFEKTFAKFCALKIWRPMSSGKYVMPDLSTLTKEERVHQMDEFEKWKEGEFWNNLLNLAHNLLCGIFREGGSFETPVKLPQDHQKVAEGMTLHQLNFEIKNNLDVNVERICEGIRILRETYFSDEAKARIERGDFLEIKVRNLSYSFHAPDDYEEVVREKIEVLEEARRFHERVREIYKAEVKKREVHKPETLKKLIKKAEDICDEAKKCRNTIIKTASKFKTGAFENFEAGEEFLTSRERYGLLEKYYYDVKTEVGNVTHFDEIKAEFPRFPKALDADVLTKASSIKSWVESERKRRISQR